MLRLGDFGGIGCEDAMGFIQAYEKKPLGMQIGIGDIGMQLVWGPKNLYPLTITKLPRTIVIYPEAYGCSVSMATYNGCSYERKLA